MDENGLPKIAWWCKNSGATVDKNAVRIGGYPQSGSNNASWNHQFAFTYELGMYYNFTLEGPAFRPTGCKGINMPLSEYPYTNGLLGISHESHVMDCDKSTYAPEGETISDIFDEFADNHDMWVMDFLDAWVIMTSNGASDLQDAEENSWLGHYTIKGKF